MRSTKESRTRGFSKDKREERRDPTAVEIIRRDLCKLGCVSNTTYSVVSPFYLRTPSHHPITSFRLSSKLDLARCLFRKLAFCCFVGQKATFVLFGLSHKQNQCSLRAWNFDRGVSLPGSRLASVKALWLSSWTVARKETV